MDRKIGGFHVFIIALIFLSVISIWHIDVAVGWSITGMMTNGFMEWPSIQRYHIAMYSLLITTFLLATTAMYGVSSKHDGQD